MVISWEIHSRFSRERNPAASSTCMVASTSALLSTKVSMRLGLTTGLYSAMEKNRL
jgi:hypothetical protein